MSEGWKAFLYVAALLLIGGIVYEAGRDHCLAKYGESLCGWMATRDDVQAH
jgi:hypothetical protein